jgi:hypothetical protein
MKILCPKCKKVPVNAEVVRGGYEKVDVRCFNIKKQSRKRGSFPDVCGGSLKSTLFDKIYKAGLRDGSDSVKNKIRKDLGLN